MITQIKSMDIDMCVWKEIHTPIKSVIPNNRDNKFPPKESTRWWENGQTRFQSGENIFVTSIYNPLKNIFQNTVVALINKRVLEQLNDMVDTYSNAINK